jgi:hypothetical protein
MAVKLGNGKWAIKEDKLLAYNDNSGRFFNKEFDFSRGSSATYVAKDGLIKTAGLQATNLVNNGDFSELGSEIITPDANRDFSSNTGYWTLETGVTIANGKINFTDAANNRSFYKLNLITSGKTYKLEITISGYVKGFIDSNNGNNFTFPSSNGTHTVYFVGGNPHLVIGANGTTTLSIDNISVKQVDPNDYWTLGTGWSIGDGKAISTNSTNSNLENDSISIANGKQYKFTFEITDFTGNGFVRPQLGAVGAVVGTYVQGNGVYSQILIANNNFDRIVLRTGGGDGFNGSVSNISVQEIQTDTPRIDFSDSVNGALLLEQSSTQLIQYSEDFSQWSGINSSRASILKNQVISPDGSITADRLSDADNSSNYHNLFQYLTFTSGNPYVFSFFAKAGTSDYVNFYLDNGHCAFQFSTKTLSGANSSNCTYTEFENGWYLLTFYKSSLSSTSRPISIYTGGGTSDSDGSYIGNPSKNVFIWGAQVEAGNYRTSYIPNHGVSGGVTRLADVCNNSGSAQDFSESGVLYAEISALANDLTERRITISDGTTSNRVAIEYTLSSNQIKGRVVSSSSTSANMNFTASSIVDFSKIAISYKQNEFNLWVNATKVATDTSGNAPIGLNKISFDNGTGSNAFHGNVRELQVFTEELTDEQLQKLTTI